MRRTVKEIFENYECLTVKPKFSITDRGNVVVRGFWNAGENYSMEMKPSYFNKLRRYYSVKVTIED